jgi:hypothetical protein
MEEYRHENGYQRFPDCRYRAQNARRYRAGEPPGQASQRENKRRA